MNHKSRFQTMTLRVKLKLLTANSRSRSKILLSKVAAGGTVKPHTPKAGLGLRLAKRTSTKRTSCRSDDFSRLFVPCFWTFEAISD